jgi:hypothetical protein
MFVLITASFSKDCSLFELRSVEWMKETVFVTWVFGSGTVK